MTVDDVFGATVAYEIYAVASRRLPSLTQLCRRHRSLVPLVAGIVLAHLVSPNPKGAPR